jgi:hypothetical protein
VCALSRVGGGLRRARWQARRRAARPALSAKFDARLRERIATLSRPAARSDLRARVEHEHDALVGALERAARRRAVLGAAGSVTATLCVLGTVRDVLTQHAGELHAVLGGGWLLPGTVGALVVVGVLAWATRAETLPMLGFGR